MIRLTLRHLYTSHNTHMVCVFEDGMIAPFCTTWMMLFVLVVARCYVLRK